MKKLPKAIDGFKADLELRGFSQAAISFNTGVAKQFLYVVAYYYLSSDKIQPDDITLKFYLTLLRERGLRQSSIEKYFSALNTLFEYLLTEGQIDINPLPAIRKRYLKTYKKEIRRKQIISIKQAADLVNSIFDVRDKTIVLLLFKTGIRRKELVELDLSDVDFKNQSITLKPTPKRSNRIVFFDDETAIQLKRWLRARDSWNYKKSKSLFLNRKGQPLTGHYIQLMITEYATNAGLHDPSSNKPEDRFSPHCCRHWFTTHLRRAGMPREFIQELRGDVHKDAIDIYDHIDLKELKESYMQHMPQLGI